MDEKNMTPQERNLLTAAKLIKKHCDEHNFYATGDCCVCVFAQKGECCPFDGLSVPADWEV